MVSSSDPLVTPPATTSPAGSRWRRFAVVAGVVVAFAGVLSVNLPVCPMAVTLGIPCPGCGLTRATLATLQGDFAAALRFHPLVWLVTPIFGLALANGAFQYVRGPSVRSASSWVLERWVTAAATVLLVVVVGVWLARFAGMFGGPAPVERVIWIGR